MPKPRRIKMDPSTLCATVSEGRGTVAVCWSGRHEPAMEHVERHAREVAAIPDIIAAAEDLAARLDGEDILNPRQAAALRKLQRAIAKTRITKG